MAKLLVVSPKIKHWFANLVFPTVVLICMLLSGCNLPLLNSNSSAGSAIDDPTINNMTLNQALAVQTRDDRPGILDQMGPPDSFKITIEILNSQVVRQEEWSYYDDQTRFDFVDGTLIATAQIETVPSGAVFASLYDPLAFQAGMTFTTVQGLLEGQTLAVISLADQGVPNGTAAFGSQILLGFDNGQLVYVETLVITPEAAQ